MNYLIISDIHGSKDRLKDVLSTTLDYDGVILVGDSLYHGPRNPILEDYDPSGVADILNSIAVPILGVRGNCDAEVDQMLLHFPMMQDFTILNNYDQNIFITHGHIYEPKDAPLTKANIFISGHTHLPGFTKEKDVLCVNPGSISHPKGGHRATYGFMDKEGITIYTLDHQVYDSYKHNGVVTK